HEAGLAAGPALLLVVPAKTDQRGTEDIRAQERQEKREAAAAIDPVLHGVSAVPRLEERGIPQHGRQRRDAENGELQRGQEAVEGVEDAQERVQSLVRRL